jgi:hypothetical protein
MSSSSSFHALSCHDIVAPAPYQLPNVAEHDADCFQTADCDLHRTPSGHYHALRQVLMGDRWCMRLRVAQLTTRTVRCRCPLTFTFTHMRSLTRSVAFLSFGQPVTCLSTRVAVMDKGAVREIGRPLDLLQLENGLFRDLAQQQQQQQ